MLVFDVDEKKRRRACLGHSLKWICRVKAVAVHDEDRGDQTFRFPSNYVSVELDQQVTFAHPLPFRDPNLKAFPIQAHRFNSNMNQNLDTFIGGESDGVPVSVNLNYRPVAWRQKPLIERVDGQTVSSHALSESWIWYFLKWDNGSGQGRTEYKIHEACSFTHQLSAFDGEPRITSAISDKSSLQYAMVGLRYQLDSGLVPSHAIGL
jgi:hypothetical protein